MADFTGRENGSFQGLCLYPIMDFKKKRAAYIPAPSGIRRRDSGVIVGDNIVYLDCVAITCTVSVLMVRT